MDDKRDRMLSLFFEEFIKSGHEETLFASITDEGKLFQSDSISDVLIYIKSCLNSGLRRKLGSKLLCRVLRHCSTEVFQQNAEVWSKLLLQALQSNDEYNVQEVTCQAFQALLCYSQAFPELCRSLSVNIIPQLISRLLQFPEAWRNLTFNMFVVCIKTFPGPCGNVRLKMEQLVLRWLVDSDVACKVYSYLPQCGGAGSLSIKYTTAWSTSFNKLLSSVSDCLNELYGFVEVSEDNKTDGQPLVLCDLPDMEPSRTVQLHKRIKALFKTMIYMLRPNFPASVSLNLKAVLQMICRVMAISPDFLLTRPTQDRVRLAGIVPSLHIAALSVLNTVISFFGSIMIPLTSVVNHLYSQCILWIRKLQKTTKYGTEMAYTGVEKALWASIITWLETLGANSGIENIADDLVKAIVQIATPIQDTVSADQNSSKLGEVSGMFHGQRGKGKKRAHLRQEHRQISSQRKLNYTADWEVLTLAWRAADLIISKVGAFITTSCYQAIHNVLFMVLAPVQAPIPYGRPECMSAALSTLLACVTCPHPAYPAPVQIALELFTRHQYNPRVQKQCSDAVTVCENIIHPRAPSLQTPLTAENITTKQQQEEANKTTYVLPTSTLTNVSVSNEIMHSNKDSTCDEDEEMKDEDPISEKADSIASNEEDRTETGLESDQESEKEEEEEHSIDEMEDTETNTEPLLNSTNHITTIDKDATEKIATEEDQQNTESQKKPMQELSNKPVVKMPKFENEDVDNSEEVDMMLDSFVPE